MKAAHNLVPPRVTKLSPADTRDTLFARLSKRRSSRRRFTLPRRISSSFSRKDFCQSARTKQDRSTCTRFPPKSLIRVIATRKYCATILVDAKRGGPPNYRTPPTTPRLSARIVYTGLSPRTPYSDAFALRSAIHAANAAFRSSSSASAFSIAAFAAFAASAAS